MKYGVIDIGSNSVRLMISHGTVSQYKKIQTTRLAEGMGDECVLQPLPIDRTVRAVCAFVELAKNEKVDELFVFATAAVRQAVNKDDFIQAVKKSCGITVEVISGENEAELGLKGALNGCDGGIIDVGGASSEVTICVDNTTIYKKSIDVGAVKLKDFCGQDRDKTKSFIKDKIGLYGTIPTANFYSIGGTATTLAAVSQQLDPYDPKKVDGYKLTVFELKRLVDLFYTLTMDERKKLKGLQPDRAEVIAGGALLLLEIVEKIGVDYITVSEKDNLEGFLMMKTENL